MQVGLKITREGEGRELSQQRKGKELGDQPKQKWKKKIHFKRRTSGRRAFIPP